MHGCARPQGGEDAVQCSTSGGPAKGTKAKAGGSGTTVAAASVQIDVDWVSEHAAQVARMLPGGGCMGWGTEGSYSG